MEREGKAVPVLETVNSIVYEFFQEFKTQICLECLYFVTEFIQKVITKNIHLNNDHVFFFNLAAKILKIKCGINK